MRRGGDDSAVESMVVAVDVEGALPLPSMELVDDAEDNAAGLAVRGALRRLTFRRQQLWRALQPDESGLLASETPEYVRELRSMRHATGADGPPLDQLAHWHYDGG